MLIKDHFFPISLPHNNPWLSANCAWYTAESGTNTQFSALAGEAGHPGILRIRTSNSSGSFGRLFAAPSGWHNGTQPNSIVFSDVVSFEWVARITDQSSVAFTLSLADSIYLTQAVAFTFDTNVDGNLRCTTSGSSGPETTNITAPNANTWHSFKAECQPGQVDFLINGTLVASHTDASKLPTQALTPYAAIFARASAYKYLDLDLFELI